MISFKGAHFPKGEIERFCREFSAELNDFPASFRLNCQFRELLKWTESGRELAFTDHVCDFDTIKRCGSRFERLEPQHRSRQPFDEAMILLDDVV